MDKVRVGVVNTGWWADAMYLPALTAHQQAEVVAVCGRNPDRAEAFAQKWNVPKYFTDYRTLMTSGLCDAVIVAASHTVHHEITMAALDNDLHVLCEKPLARNVTEAKEMAELAQAKGVKTAVPFTYRFMPHARFIKQLVEDGYLGKPHHLNIRFYHEFGREPHYDWRWDLEKAGSGDVGNLGSHCIYLAIWYFGDVESVSAELRNTVDRGELDPDGNPFTAADDNGILSVQFTNGALGSIHYSSVAYESSHFGQQHFMDLHGSTGTLYNINDWAEHQETLGARAGEIMGPLEPPDEIWGHAKIKNVHESYKAVFRKDGHMVGEFIDNILTDTVTLPTFDDGLKVQKIIAAAQVSSDEGRRVLISEFD